MTNFFEIIKNRHSVRLYQTRLVEKDKLLQILDCIRTAPSAGNLQAYRVVVVEDIRLKQALARAAFNQNHIATAPVVLVFFQDTIRSMNKYGQRGKELYALQDATIACTFAHLAATALDLGSCWTGAFNAYSIEQLLNAPEGLTPIALLSLGYPQETPIKVVRRSVEELVCWDNFITAVDDGIDR